MLNFPIQTGLGNEPRGENGESQMMFPSAVLNGLKLVLGKFGFGILVGAFNEIALGFALGKDEQRRLGRGIGQAVGHVTTLITTQE